jgi:hypothetical protein
MKPRELNFTRNNDPTKVKFSPEQIKKMVKILDDHFMALGMLHPKSKLKDDALTQGMLFTYLNVAEHNFKELCDLLATMAILKKSMRNNMEKLGL